MSDMNSVDDNTEDCKPVLKVKNQDDGESSTTKTQEMREKDSTSKSTNDDVRRAIEGLKEIPDEELQEFLDDEDFMEGLDVVDAWEGEEEKSREVEQDVKPVKKEKKSPLRERHRTETKGSSDSRDKPKREERRRDELRRDPSKSLKDIERDKIRTKRDTESKLLAEKEKAIKHLLDSDNVVPPGTESEAIQSITEEQNRERAQRDTQRNKDHHRRSADRYGGRPSPRRRSPDRLLRPSPHRRRSPFLLSPERRRSPVLRNSSERHKSPFRYSPTRRKNSPRYIDRRSPVVSSPDRRRSPRLSNWERRSSAERRWSVERHRRRDMHERRRSRSRDRRSRSTDRSRRRSSRSPAGRRYSPRRRSRTRSRSPEKRGRKRSPFINELARQLRNEAMMPTGVNSGGYVAPPATVEEIAPLLNASIFPPEGESRPPQPQPPPPPPPSVTPFHAHQSGPLPPPPVLPMAPSVGLPFMGFESMPAIPPIPFHEAMTSHPIPPVEYSSGPVMYNQSNNTTPVQQPPLPPVIRSSLLPAPMSVSSPQPVPAPVMDHPQMPYKALHVNVPSVQAPLLHQFETAMNNKSTTNHATMSAPQVYKEHGSAYNADFHVPREERMKTPEPPIISKPKQFEKTSLSSLLEASVSAKDPSNIPMLYRGFKPEIMRYCEQALCQLPLEDPRLKMKGRFFYDRNEESSEKTDPVDHISNSILLQKSKTKIYWEEYNAEQQVPISKAPMAQMHQKICQTDEVEKETRGVQTRVVTSDFESQVYPRDLDYVQVKEEKRPVMDRLDWSVRETYDYAPKYREVEDLRWSLSNSSRRGDRQVTWNRQESPTRESEHEHHLDPMDHSSRNLRESSTHSRESFSGHKTREHYSHTRYSPDYHRRSMERDEFHERRSDHSRGESPMDLEQESDDDLVTGFAMQRGSDWHGRGKLMRGKSYNPRGKYMGGRSHRVYRGRGGHRGKF